ncbi:MADF domain-containing protein, partial [Aphis craccivora]
MSGVKVDGVVSDAGSTNRKLWRELGICGKFDNLKNYIVHPMDEKRRIYFFTDAPHLIKTVRNRLHNNKTLKISPEKESINWEHYITLHSNDLKNISKRVCPKITNRHLFLDSFSKMNVKLATQVFSNSVSVGLKYYREIVQVKSLENSQETEYFTKLFNDIFDVLNRKFPAEGIRKYSKDFEILENALIFLDNWEHNLLKKKINESEFLTKQTVEGLRVSIKSTIELSNYLLDIGFHYVLSNKMNQDKLEVITKQFFGII